MMPPGVAYGAGAVLGLIGLIRGRQTWRVLLPRATRAGCPSIRYDPAKIPPAAASSFRRGFRWTETHLSDCAIPSAEVQRYVQPGSSVSMGPARGRLGIGPDSEFVGATVFRSGQIGIRFHRCQPSVANRPLHR